MKRKILIIDNEIAWCDLIKEAIESANLGKCQFSCTGVMGLALFKANIQNSIPYDVVLLDIHLNEHNGLTVLDKMREFEEKVGMGNTTIIMVTGTTREKEEAEKRQSNGYLNKPFSIAELRNYINV